MAYNSLLKENVRSTESDYSRGLLEGYKKGVNDILQEIEAIIEEYSEYYPGNNESFISYNVLIGKINELKGE